MSGLTFPLNPLNALRKKVNSTGQTVLDDASDLALGQTYGYYHVPSGSGDVELNEAVAWLQARFPFGVIKLDPFGSYTLGDTWAIETGVVGVDGNRSKLNAQSLSAANEAILLTNTTNGDNGTQYPFSSFVDDVYVIGNSGSTRDYNAVGIRANTAINNSSVRCAMRNVFVDSFGTGISVGSRAYMLKGYEVYAKTCGTGLLFESGVTDYAENVTFQGGAIYNCDTLIKSLAGHRFTLQAVSLDYFGDKTGGRITASDRSLDLQAGTVAELYACHQEWEYGLVAGQTNSPIRLTGANTKLIMKGGYFGTPSTTRTYLFNGMISSDNSSQEIIIEDVRCSNLGRTGQPTNDDQMVIGSSSNGTGSIGHVVCRNLIAHNNSLNDLPTFISLTNGPGANFQRNGVDDPHSELSKRIVVTGTAAVASVGTTDGGVTARNSTGNMLKITGAGKVLISFPNYDPSRRFQWGLFLNVSQGVGTTITVKQRDCTVVQKWDGSTGITVSADTRNSYSSATKTITLGGTNQFERVGWKDVLSGPTWSSRMTSDVIAIEIDTANMTSGAIYLDDSANSLM